MIYKKDTKDKKILDISEKRHDNHILFVNLIIAVLTTVYEEISKNETEKQGFLTQQSQNNLNINNVNNLN